MKEIGCIDSVCDMASASLGSGNGNGGVGSSRSALRGSSSSVDWLGREMLEMRLRDKVEHGHDDDDDDDDDRVSCRLNSS